MGCELLIVALIGTVVLQAAVILFNRLAGGLKKAIKEPPAGTACGIVVAAHGTADEEQLFGSLNSVTPIGV